MARVVGSSRSFAHALPAGVVMRGQAIYNRAPSASSSVSANARELHVDPFPSGNTESPSFAMRITGPFVMSRRRREVDDVAFRASGPTTGPSPTPPDSQGDNESEASPRAKRTRR
jgi:hypothetical protein